MARTTATISFQALELKGALLPASLLEEVACPREPCAPSCAKRVSAWMPFWRADYHTEPAPGPLRSARRGAQACGLVGTTGRSTRNLRQTRLIARIRPGAALGLIASLV
jgi:hypothetical protein